MPAVVPLTRHDLLDVGFKQARQRREAHVASLVLDLQREIPNIRAFGLRGCHEAEQAATNRADDSTVKAAEVSAFWALLELLLASSRGTVLSRSSDTPDVQTVTRTRA